MKKLITLITVLSLVSVLHAQKYQTTLKYINNRLEIYIMPEATLTNAGFSSIEFFVRFPATLPLMFSDFQPETSNFPLITFGGNELTPIVRGTDATNKSIKISYLAGATETTLRNYTGGVEYKVCSMAVTGSPTATFQIVHNAVTFDPYFVTLTDNNSEDAAPASPNNYFYPTTINNVSDPTLFYYEISNVALPVTLLDFTAKVENIGALLSWKTESEVNVSHFDVEKSSDGKAFIKIGEMKANNLPSDYSTFDENFNESSYYRLIINELDGRFNFSKVVYLEKKDNKTIKIARYTEGSLFVETDDKIELITISNTVGQVLKSTKEKQISVNDLNAGMYLISVKTDRGFASQKFFKN
jgi:hypothetical protein